FVPLHSSFGHALLHEAARQPRVGLNDLSERMSALDRRTNFLQLANSFVEQPHFFERHPKVVVRVGIFRITGAGSLLQVFLEFIKEVAECGVDVRGLCWRGRRSWSRWRRNLGCRFRRGSRSGRSSGFCRGSWFVPGLSAEGEIVAQ